MVVFLGAAFVAVDLGFRVVVFLGFSSTTGVSNTRGSCLVSTGATPNIFFNQFNIVFSPLTGYLYK